MAESGRNRQTTIYFFAMSICYCVSGGVVTAIFSVPICLDQTTTNLTVCTLAKFSVKACAPYSVCVYLPFVWKGMHVYF